MPSERLRVGTDTITLHAGGNLLAADVHLPPGGGPPALHRHAPDELYRGEAGELTVYLEADDGTIGRTTVAAGDVVHIPGGRAHTVRNESAASASAYVVFSPGAEMERFVRAAAALSPSSPEALSALAEAHGIEFTGSL